MLLIAGKGKTTVQFLSDSGKILKPPGIIFDEKEQYAYKKPAE